MKSDKPASAMSRPNAASSTTPEADSEALKEAREEQRDLEAIDARKAAHASKVAAMLGATWYATDYTWPYLRTSDRQMSVSEFYPELNIAVDKFYHFGAHEERIVEEKKRLLNENGIRYVFLNPDKSLADVGAELDDQDAQDVKAK